MPGPSATRGLVYLAGTSTSASPRGTRRMRPGVARPAARSAPSRGRSSSRAATWPGRNRTVRRSCPPTPSAPRRSRRAPARRRAARRIIDVSTPRRRWVGCTATDDTPATGTSAPPGIVSSNVYERVQPTISPRSNAHCVRSSSARTQLSGRSGVRGGAPNPRRSTSSMVGSSASVIGRTSSAIRPFYSDGRRPVRTGLPAASVAGPGPGAAPRRRTRGRRTASTSATRKIPARPPPGKTTASSPPNTQTSWKRVSNRANARPRAASAPSRCRRLSNASRPRRRRRRDRGRRDHERRTSVRPRREHERDARNDQRAREDPLLTRPAPQERREHGPDPGADRAHHQHEAVHPRRLAVAT